MIIRDFQTLSTLNICDNKIDFEGIQSLSQALIKNKVRLINFSFFLL